MNGFGEFIKLNRINKKYTQKQMAKKLNISQSCYSRIENNLQEPTLLQLQQLSSIFHISLDDLLYGLANTEFNDSDDIKELFMIANKIINYR
ncbi:MAG: helix-turn-helix domain-containing protein [Anaeroplasmataceae bacterium]